MTIDTGKLKYPRTLHWPWSETIHKDDKIHQNPEFFIGKEVVVTEKLDGGNSMLLEGTAFARSTGQEATAGWFAMVKKHHAWKTYEYPQIAFYGEDLFGIHSIEYDAIPETQTYHLFAVRDFATNMFASWDDLRHLWSAAINVPVVPEVFRGKFSSLEEITAFFKAERQNRSALGPEREGFVMRVAEEFHADEFQQKVCKFVRAGHVQTDEHWTKNWQPCKLL